MQGTRRKSLTSATSTGQANGHVAGFGGGGFSNGAIITRGQTRLKPDVLGVRAPRELAYVTESRDRRTRRRSSGNGSVNRYHDNDNDDDDDEDDDDELIDLGNDNGGLHHPSSHSHPSHPSVNGSNVINRSNDYFVSRRPPQPDTTGFDPPLSISTTEDAVDYFGVSRRPPETNVFNGDLLTFNDDELAPPVPPPPVPDRPSSNRYIVWFQCNFCFFLIPRF